MRKSVMIGFGLWLLAVASVAGIAWVAIDRAGRQVTNVSAAAPSPNMNGAQGPVISTVDADPATSPQGTSTASPTARRTSPAASRSDQRAYFGTFTTDGGRVRARCLGGTATLDGGYARPEPGWMVRVLSKEDKLWIVFGSQSRAIAVVAQCERGRPTFEQRSQQLPEGGSIPLPGQPLPGGAGPTPTMPQPSASPPQFASPLTQLQPAPVPTKPMAEPGPAGPMAAPGAQVPGQPDAAQVEAYIAAADRMCAASGGVSDWCRGWAAMSPQERYSTVWRWLASRSHWDDRSGWDRSGDHYGDAGTATPTGSATATESGIPAW